MIVVTGGTGNVGGVLVRLLVGAGEQVTAVSRRPAPSSESVRSLAGDLAEPDSLKAAFDGGDALFLHVAGSDPEGVLDAAAAGGIRRVVLLSSQGAGSRPALYAQPVVFEEAVRRSGLEWTILRPGGFHSNALAWAEPIRAHRTAAAPFADVALPFIDPADIAEVAAVALRRDEHVGRTYVLTGPRPITPRERAATIGEVLGEQVRFVEQSRQEAREQMLRFMPAQAVEGTLTILGTPTSAEQQVSPDVEGILGRAPGTFADWAARNATAFR